ncbi:ABC transporter substrate-binding protein [Castellaniella hirudinis]|uniref:ABC transporter substrate-binding protein n=1 Tax=Castellaniella hirudinis TaxID=1144617 RepID=UPI0039C08869
MPDFSCLWTSRRPLRPGAFLKAAALAGLLGAACPAAAQAVPAAAQAVAPWRLGVAGLPPAPVPGAKDRTPARIEVLAGQAGGAADLRAVDRDQAAAQLRQAALDGWVGVWPAEASLPPGVRREPLDWSASPMAIMRTDTDIHAWADLAGRTVCLSADGRYVGELAARQGAIEQVYPSATDALLALRIGQCDAAVQDEDFLRQLLKFPEWKKFSAQLAPYRRATLAQLSRADLPDDAARALRQAVAPGQLRQLAQQQAKSIAFEVYLDQAVPDCH